MAEIWQELKKRLKFITTSSMPIPLKTAQKELKKGHPNRVYETVKHLLEEQPDLVPEALALFNQALKHENNDSSSLAKAYALLNH